MTALFVAGAGGSGNQQLATSPDGITWTIRTAVAIPGSYVFQAVVWSPELAKFVAVTNGYGSVTSPDGITWTASSATITAYGLAWSPLKAIFVASAGSGVFTSPDGLTWTSRTAGLGASGILNTVVWSPELAKFVAGGSQSTDLIFTSPDGITWTQTASFGVSEVPGAKSAGRRRVGRQNLDLSRWHHMDGPHVGRHHQDHVGGVVARAWTVRRRGERVRGYHVPGWHHLDDDQRRGQHPGSHMVTDTGDLRRCGDQLWRQYLP
jgi:hypothetical protein